MVPPVLVLNFHMHMVIIHRPLRGLRYCVWSFEMPFNLFFLKPAERQKSANFKQLIIPYMATWGWYYVSFVSSLMQTCSQVLLARLFPVAS